MLSGAMDVSLDKQGRFIIPDYLRSYAGLEKKVVIVGVNTRFELWDEEKWNAYRAKTEESAGDIAEQLGDFAL